MTPVIVISLRRSPERRDAMQSQLGQLRIPFRFHDAMDGSLLTEDEATQLCPRRHSLTRRYIMSKNEVACLESHKACLEQAAASGADFTCILEDDAQLAADFASFLDPMWLSSLPAFDILKFGGDGHGRKEELVRVVTERSGRRVCAPLHPTYSAIGYVVSLTGARTALDHMRRIQDTADVCLFRRPATNARILDVRPFPVVPAHTRSTIIHETTFKNAGPWWRRYVSWLPNRLALMENRPRRCLAFVRAQGVAALRRLELVPMR